MKRLLLTGSSGFIGRNCLDELSQGGWEVHAVDRRSAGRPPAAATFHQIDLMSRAEVRPLLAKVRPSHLLHLAWSGARPVYRSLENFRWVRGSLRLFEEFASAGGERIVALGSGAEYRWGSKGDCIEDRTPASEDTAYGVCKSALSRLFLAFCRETGVSGAWPRAFFLYGPYENPERFAASVITSLLRDQPARCTHGRQIRDFLYSRDLAAGLVHLLTSDYSGAVNLASGRGVSLAEIARVIAVQLGREDLLELGALPAPESEAPRVVASVERLAAEVGWSPSTDLRQGLSETVEWWRGELNLERSEDS